jgi:GNAT superfamily N-acetyltransferase
MIIENPTVDLPTQKQIVLIQHNYELVEAFDIYTNFLAEQGLEPSLEVQMNYITIFSRPKEKLFGMEIKNKIVGTISTEYKGEGKTIIRKFFVDKRHRGKGIGFDLFNQAIGQSIANNICTAKTSIYLATVSDWKKAVEFYEKVGMTSISKEQFEADLAPKIKARPTNDKFFMMYV